MKYWQIIRNFSILFAILACIELIAHPVFPTFPYLRYTTKPLIMISLIGLFIYRYRGNFRTWHWAVFFAFVFSLLGDVFLLFEGQQFFLFGLSSFLLAHIAYIYTFRRRASTFYARSILAKWPLLIVPFLLYGAALVAFLYQDLGKMLIPVVVYSSVIMCMVLAALNRWDRVSLRSFVMVFAGALLFMVSDSLIAINMFTLKIPMGSIWIMLTYMAAQYLIAMGLLEIDASNNIEPARFN